jgi:uncharacterized membrane protein
MLMRTGRELPEKPPRREDDVSAWVFFVIGLAILAAVLAVAVLMSR